MNSWDKLGIAHYTTDARVVKRAYAKLIAVHHPEDDPEGFMAIQQAYEEALAYAKNGRSFGFEQWKYDDEAPSVENELDTSEPEPDKQTSVVEPVDTWETSEASEQEEPNESEPDKPIYTFVYQGESLDNDLFAAPSANPWETADPQATTTVNKVLQEIDTLLTYDRHDPKSMNMVELIHSPTFRQVMHDTAFMQGLIAIIIAHDKATKKHMENLAAAYFKTPQLFGYKENPKQGYTYNELRRILDERSDWSVNLVKTLTSDFQHDPNSLLGKMERFSVKVRTYVILFVVVFVGVLAVMIWEEDRALQNEAANRMTADTGETTVYPTETDATQAELAVLEPSALELPTEPVEPDELPPLHYVFRVTIFTTHGTIEQFIEQVGEAYIYERWIEHIENEVSALRGYSVRVAQRIVFDENMELTEATDVLFSRTDTPMEVFEVALRVFHETAE